MSNPANEIAEAMLRGGKYYTTREVAELTGTDTTFATKVLYNMVRNTKKYPMDVAPGRPKRFKVIAIDGRKKPKPSQAELWRTAIFGKVA